MRYNLIYLIQGILLIAFTPLFSGVLKKFKALLRGVSRTVCCSALL